MKCELCNKQVRTKKNRFCSIECYNQYQKRNYEQTKICVCCGKSFGRNQYKRNKESLHTFHRRKFCSHKCSLEVKRAKRCVISCKTCGTEFFDAKSKNRKYCSQECYSKAPKSWRRKTPIAMPERWKGWEIMDELAEYL